MGIGKKTTFMVLVSLGLLIGLGIADPSNTRLMPSFFSHEWIGVLPKGAIEEEGARHAIVQFNRDLSTAYLELDPAAITANPMADDLKRHYVEEIAFLKKDGRALEMTVPEIRIKKVARLPSELLSVDTVESVKVRYLNPADRTEIAAHPVASYEMNYSLDKSGSGWNIVGVETMKAGGRNE